MIKISRGNPDVILDICNSVLDNGEKKMMKYKDENDVSRDLRDEIKPVVREWSKRGYRVIAYCFTEFPIIRDWVQAKQIQVQKQPDGTEKKIIAFNMAQNIFAGLIALEDPLKNHVQDCLHEFKKSGIKM